MAGTANADPAMGNFEGKILANGWEKAVLTAEIIGTGRDGYRADLHVASEGKALADAQLKGIKEGDAAALVGSIKLGETEDAGFRVFATAMDGAIRGTLMPVNGDADDMLAFFMERVHKQPPSLGAAPPEGAVVLLNGNNLDAWNLSPSNLVDGALQIGGSSFISKQEFGDHKLHLEFCTPYLPEEEGQGRGNSGVYVQGRYEVQVLDSFGLPPADNHCGGIYSIAAPAVEADLPPGEWQTYDMEFRAPKFNAKGEKIENARITVQHNGLVIHDDIELPHTTPGGVSGSEAPQGPLMLQEHGNRVQFRNIWIAPLN
jgi:hypothetical protein